MKTRIVSLCVLIATLVLSVNLAAGAPPGLTFVEHQRDINMEVPYGLALSPDGQQLYVTNNIGGLSVFARNGDSGALTWLETEKNGVGGVEGMDGASNVVVSPDGYEIYVASSVDDSVVEFGRNLVSGEMDYVTRYTHDEDFIRHLMGAHDILISNSGEHLYVASVDSHSVSFFRRDTSNGDLTQVQTLVDELGGVDDGLEGAINLALHPSGDYLFVASIIDDAIAILRRHTGGNLSYVGMAQDGEDGVEGLRSPWDVAVSPDGNHVYATGTYDDGIVIFDWVGDEEKLVYAGRIQATDEGLSALEDPYTLVIGEDGRDLYAGGNGGIVHFRRDPSSGQLTFADSILNDDHGPGSLQDVLNMLLSPDEQYLYATVSVGASVVTLLRDPDTGSLGYLGAEKSIPFLGGTIGVAVDPDGEYVVVASNNDDAVVYFERNSHTGALTPARYYPDNSLTIGLKGARAVAITSDGQHTYVAGYDSNAVAIFGPQGDLGWTYQGYVRHGEGGVVSMRGPQSLTLSPDDKHLYVACPLDDSVVAFKRDSDDGTLDYLGRIQQGIGGVDGLVDAYHIALDPEGRHAYVAGYGSDAIAHFSRRATTGYLDYEGVMNNGGDIAGLDGVSSLAVSPDGAWLYAAGRKDNALAIFTRDDDSGDLTFYGYAPDGVGANTGLQGARAVTVSPDGRFVYVASQNSHAVAVFIWDDETGDIRFFEAHVDGENGVDGLRTANGIAISADGRHLYVTGYDDDAIALFRTRAHTYLPAIIR